jgi:hypothetical protein
MFVSTIVDPAKRRKPAPMRSANTGQNPSAIRHEAVLCEPCTVSEDIGRCPIFGRTQSHRRYRFCSMRPAVHFFDFFPIHMSATTANV